MIAKSIKTSNDISILTEIIYCLESSTIHGVAKLIRARNFFIRFLWFQLLICSSFCCVYLIKGTILDYLSFNVITKIRIQNEHSFKFPTITICNKNTFTSDESVNYLNNLAKENNFSYFNNTSLNFTKYMLREDLSSSLPINLKDFFNIAKSNIIMKNFTNQQKENLSLPINEFILFCRFVGQKCDLKNDFESIFISQYGNCFSFNTKANNTKKILTRPGEINGFKFELYVGLPDEISQKATERGAIIFINVSSNFDLYQISVEPGRETIIGLKKYVTELLPYPYSDCIDLVENENKNDLIGIIKRNNLTYSQELCKSLCFQKYLNMVCNCFENFNNEIDYFFDVETKRICFSKNDLKCLRDFYLRNFTRNNFIQQKCKCSIECEKISHERLITYSKYPTKIITDSIRYDKILEKSVITKQGDFKNDLENNLVRVNIYFDSLSYVHIKEYPGMNEIGLISSIGGTLGLFLGMSLLSLTESVELLLSILISIFKKIKNKSQISNI